MDADEFTALIRVEDDRTEWEQSARDQFGIMKAACALANDLGDTRRDGRLVIGVDKAGRGVGIAETELEVAQREVSGWLHGDTRLLPSPSVAIELVRSGGLAFLVVTVAPYPVPPIVALGNDRRRP